MAFKRTEKQAEAIELMGGDATVISLMGGSGSGKTFVALYALCVRALRQKSTHCVIRSTQRDCRQKIGLDMFPTVLEACFPGVYSKKSMSRTDWYYTFPNGSVVWFYGLDGDGLDKILGPSYSTFLFEECSELSWPLIQKAMTRLREKTALNVKAYCTYNPPKKSHWTYKVFIEQTDPIDNEPIRKPEKYATILMNPHDNLENLDEQYIELLEGLSKKERDRFLWGKFGDEEDGNLWKSDWISQNRIKKSEMPLFFERIAVGVDPAVSTKKHSDNTGIVATGISEGNAYILDDYTGKWTPAEWSAKVAQLYEKYSGCITGGREVEVVAERNRGGDLVKENIVRNYPHIRVDEVNATRGKFTRAEPVAALYERGLVHHTDIFTDLEDEMTEYNPDTLKRSPDRLDAAVYSITHLLISNPTIRPTVSTATYEMANEVEPMAPTLDEMLDNDDLWL